MRLILALLLFVSTAYGQALNGHDFIGLASNAWKVKQTVEAIPPGTVVGLFADETFGPLAIANTIKLLDSGKVVAVRAQMHWSYQHKIVPLDKLKKLLPKWEVLAQKYPQVKFYISHSCEYSESNLAEIQKRVDLVKQLAPNTIVVQTPMKSPVVPGELIEVHTDKGDVMAGRAVSTDGNSLFDADAAKWVLNTEDTVFRLAWGVRYNLAEAHNTTPANQRTAAPEKKYIISLQRLFGAKEVSPQPTFVGNVVPFTGKLLFKSHAEDMPGANARDNRPLIIIPKKTESVQVVTYDGKPVCRFMYFGGFPNNLHRFYSGLPGGCNLYGYEIADKAKALSGYESVWFKQGNTYYGPIIGSHRCCYYQN